MENQNLLVRTLPLLLVTMKSNPTCTTFEPEFVHFFITEYNFYKISKYLHSNLGSALSNQEI